jgi:hypothetical protein
MSSREGRVNPHVHGERPAHLHTDSDGEQWQCNSPYCIDMKMDPPEKGGPQPIIQGYEPWKGR